MTHCKLWVKEQNHEVGLTVAGSFERVALIAVLHLTPAEKRGRLESLKRHLLVVGKEVELRG